MSDDNEAGHKVILPIHESDEESDLSLDPAVEDESCEEESISDDDPHPLDICQRCGASDRDLVQWGSDEECFVCVDCHCCEECGSNQPELIDFDNGQGYICIECATRADRIAMQDADVNVNDAGHDQADNAEVNSFMQQSGNPYNSDPEATQWGVPSVGQGGPTSFMDVEQ